MSLRSQTRDKFSTELERRRRRRFDAQQQRQKEAEAALLREQAHKARRHVRIDLSGPMPGDVLQTSAEDTIGLTDAGNTNESLDPEPEPVAEPIARENTFAGVLTAGIAELRVTDAFPALGSSTPMTRQQQAPSTAWSKKEGSSQVHLTSTSAPARKKNKDRCEAVLFSNAGARKMSR